MGEELSYQMQMVEGSNATFKFRYWHLLTAPPTSPFSLSFSQIQAEAVHEAAYKTNHLLKRTNTSALSPSSVQANYEYNLYPQVPKGKINLHQEKSEGEIQRDTLWHDGFK